MKQNILPYRGSYYPVLGQLLHEINVAGEINKVIDVQDTQANIDVGTFTCLMTYNNLLIYSNTHAKITRFFYIDVISTLL